MSFGILIPLFLKYASGEIVPILFWKTLAVVEQDWPVDVLVTSHSLAPSLLAFFFTLTPIFLFTLPSFLSLCLLINCASASLSKYFLYPSLPYFGILEIAFGRLGSHDGWDFLFLSCSRSLSLLAKLLPLGARFWV